ncbi:MULTISPECIES: phosphoribosylamine--glycine ligase [unclassified Sphingomonas]|uniref:phosphoribosylamine--glycine ligase n=1 Tax=Sphingomonas TaxID=13687 RepID=UPI000960B9A9|nr:MULTISPECIES: phosphoribosylamine--glycine ligase [unclassified Sphingomonas]MBN8809676.1 phosphoribosylamine--glycine ligase [Sphingomonas sp.]OJY50319.1 MAG: phosphoribosylamine--glycine ligase [Sphingomonas sp. 67-41]
MNVLLLGSGGREHALAWKLAQSPLLERLYAAPGNPGIAEHAEIVDIAVNDHRAVIDFCLRHSIGFVVIGPEAPLVAGLADNLRTMGLAVFGPNKVPAQLEGSKGFTKDLCARERIPTAGYVRCESRDGALASLEDFGLPVVIKADGLAAGKGVTVAFTHEEAEGAVHAIFAEPGASVVIEEFLEGEEASLFVLTDGETLVSFGSAQDHKRVGDGDTGPNTGGMGAYSPAPVLTPALEARAIDEIVRPTIAALARMGAPYSGVLYAGLMLTPTGPKLIEYNARFGDPECQVLMMRYTGDLLQLMLAVAKGELAGQPAPTFAARTALTVVMAANGYPGTPETGGAIAGIERAEATGAKVFHAGTRMDGDTLVAAGGRVLSVTALGETAKAAQAAAYAAVDAIDFPTGFSRRDIGWREVARQP